jgi:glycine dehydrogenase
MPHIILKHVDSWTRGILPIQERKENPLDYVADNKFWPSVCRVDEPMAIEILICSCAPIEAYM